MNRLISLFLIIFLFGASFMVGLSNSMHVTAERTDTDNRAKDPPEWEYMESFTATVQIDAGESYYVSLVNSQPKLVPMEPTVLPDECSQALDLVPGWLKDNLTYKFRQLSSANQVTYANLIINSPDVKYRDEIAFCIAHSSVRALEFQYAFPNLLIDNAKYIYENDQYLNYVEIVEKADYTTLRYKNETNVSMELQRDIYYWYVVHPKLSDELPTYIDPDHDYTKHSPINERNYGVSPPTGKFWREWFFYHNDSANISGNKKPNPLLKDLLATRNTVWEAISGINTWISKSMKFTSNSERPVQPVRIYRKHIGRCGEHQDMRCAAGRAALIPTTCTMNSAEDHVWNEFWDGRWIHWDGDCDNPKKYENGWGKKISSVFNFRGDSHIWSVTDRYTDTCTFTATVLDSEGKPVDGAEVIIATENYYDPQYLTITTWGMTDHNGECTIKLGDSRNYWAAVDTEKLGEDPPDSGGEDRVTQVITNSQIGGSYTKTFNLPGTASNLDTEEATPPEKPLHKYKMDVFYEVVSNIQQGINTYTGEYCDYFGPDGNIDFFIADSENLIKYQDSETFNVYNLDERGNKSEFEFVIPTEDSYYAVFSNEFSQHSTKIVNVTVVVYGSLTTKITAPVEDSNQDLDSTVTISGTAFSPLMITGVEVDIDGNNNWQTAYDLTDVSPYAWTSWEFYWDTTGLEPGHHTIRARVTDAKYEFITLIDVTLVDVTEPELMIEEPLNNSIFKKGEMIMVSGSVADNVRMTVVQVILDEDASSLRNISMVSKNSQWSCDIVTDDLIEGIHTMSVVAFDTSENYNSTIIHFELLENQAPVVSVYDPVNNSVFKLGSTIKIYGRAKDNKDVEQLELVIDGDLIIDITSNIGAKNRFEYKLDTESLQLIEGMHTMDIRATDAAANIGSETIWVYLDDSPPALTLSAPIEENIYSAGEKIPILGNARDNTDIMSIDLIIDEGTPINITQFLVGDYWIYEAWSTKRLKTGEHNITVHATDIAGLETYSTVFITVDAEAPVVDINKINEPILIGNSVTIEGSATDDLEVSWLTLEITGRIPIDIFSKYSTSDHTWNLILNTTGLPEGALVVMVSVTDLVGKTTTGTATINLISSTTDSDDDGMPDWWEMQYERLDSGIDDSDLDYDRDGFTNLEEYLGDDGLDGNDDYSNPLKKDSVPNLKTTKPKESDDAIDLWLLILIVVEVILFVLFFLLYLKKRSKVTPKHPKPESPETPNLPIPAPGFPTASIQARAQTPRTQPIPQTMHDQTQSQRSKLVTTAPVMQKSSREPPRINEPVHKKPGLGSIEIPKLPPAPEDEKDSS